MNEEKTLKEELKKSKKNVIIAFVAGGIVGVSYNEIKEASK